MAEERRLVTVLLLDASSAVPDAALARLELFGLTHEAEVLEQADRALILCGDEIGLQRAAELGGSR